MQWAPNAKRDHQAATAIVAAAFVACLVAGLMALPRIEAYLAGRAQTDSQATLRLVSGGVHQAIRRFSPLPELIAQTPSLRTLLRDPENAGLIPFVNEKLRLTARSIGVSDIYLMDRSGHTIAASNYREDRSFVGRNFDFRPYFQDAMKGELARFHALGTTSGEPGFFFAAPVLEGIEIIGVLAVKVTTEAIEDGWAGAGREILVADGDGIIFLTSRPDLRFRALAPLSEGTQTRIIETRQFPLDVVQPLPLSTSVLGPGTVELQFGENGARYLSDSIPLDLPGWHAIVLTPLAPIAAQAVYVLAFWALAVLVLSLAAFILLQRQVRRAEGRRAERAQRELLEQTVASRTSELRQANETLLSEVAERRATEDRLRQTQKELVQAGKLAALGHMSAALSHEINQPLAAVKSYADNAVTFLDRSRIGEARDNLSLISKMADRMARISGHLRNFARRPGDKLSAVPIGQVIDAAISLTEPVARKCGAELDYTPPDEELWAIGGRLRLQQVLVNLLTNAFDAMAGGDVRRAEVRIEHTETRVDIIIRDHGPGLSDGDTEQVFEPFFTTKPVGQGLGLGLSISFNIVEDFGGKLSAQNATGGGAQFRVSLLRADDMPETDETMVAE